MMKKDAGRQSPQRILEQQAIAPVARVAGKAVNQNQGHNTKKESMGPNTKR